MRPARRLLVTGAVLGGLFLGANMVAESVAEGKIADQAQKTFGTSSKPQVEIGGFPILVNILQGSIPTASLEGSNLVVAEMSVARFRIEIEGIEASLSQLTAGAAFGVKRLLAQADVTSRAVTDYVRSRDKQVTIEVLPGKIRVTGPVPGGGTGAAEGTPRLIGRIMKFEPDRVTAGGKPLSGRVLQEARKALTFEVDIPLLPGGIKITGIDFRQGFAVLIARLENGRIDLNKIA